MADMASIPAEEGQSSVELLRERLAHMSRELQVSREKEAKLITEVEVARAEASRLKEELRLERAVRQGHPVVLPYQQAAAATVVAQPASGFDAQPMTPLLGSMGRHPATEPQAKASAPASRSSSLVRARGKDMGLGSESSPVARTASTPGPRGRHGRGPSPASASRQAPVKDEIDTRLQEFIEKSACNINFRRLNRGWYAFRRLDDQEAYERNVELSIVNGKLMAKVDATHHDAGWNNGKLGPVERFVTHFSV